ncbi:hypothetical protein [Micromonospora mirobrigensis]|uniref:Uncharacterized protein n=1 Tax=Micromonospora mirobrigensis TaxID=262898 RepID=A0A1C4WQ61_9ACTN|nr:hypothetical protein [Micromonospora mirobrigensis]SCE98387.1 hypothetical protein GA0070564_102436 [Micromonospora mirobrigensis]
MLGSPRIHPLAAAVAALALLPVTALLALAALLVTVGPAAVLTPVQSLTNGFGWDVAPATLLTLLG